MSFFLVNTNNYGKEAVPFNTSAKIHDLMSSFNYAYNMENLNDSFFFIDDFQLTVNVWQLIIWLSAY